MVLSLEAAVPPHILRDIVKKMNVKTVVRLNLSSSFGNMAANAFGEESLEKYLEGLEVKKANNNNEKEECYSGPENITLLQDVLADKRLYGSCLEKELASCLDCCFLDVEYTWARVVKLEKNKQYIEFLEKQLYYSNILHNNCFHLKEEMK